MNEVCCPPNPPNPITPPDYHDWITSMFRSACTIDSPRSYHINSIYNLVYRWIEMMYLIRKMGEGKSIVLTVASSLLGGVTISDIACTTLGSWRRSGERIQYIQLGGITIVPLLGLGADQVNKYNNRYSGFDAFHVDGHLLYWLVHPHPRCLVV